MARIGLDYTPALEQGGGIGRYVRELVAALADNPGPHDYALFVAGARPHQLPAPPAERFMWRSTRVAPRWWARIWHRARLPYAIESITGPLDLYHATDFVLPPTRRRTRTILQVHDLSFRRVPETASPRLKAYLDRVVPRSVRRADHILADSQATKDDLSALYGTPEAKIDVLHGGIHARFQPVRDGARLAEVRARYGIDAPYVFAVGTIQPRKNYARVIEALARLRQRDIDLTFVIAGGKGWLEDPIYHALERHGMADRVRFIGYAADDDLPALYSGALLSPFVSLYEGFGLPILEAMACGTPVVTGTRSSLPEVAGDAALLVDPSDTDAITDAIARLVTDSALRDELIQRGYERARRFTWDAAAARLLAIYERILVS